MPVIYKRKTKNNKEKKENKTYNFYSKDLNSKPRDKNKLSILLVSFEFPNRDGSTRGGGVSTVYYELANGLAKSGHDVLVLTHGEKEELYKENNYSVWKIQSYKGLNNTWSSIEGVKYRSKNVAQKIFELLSKKSFDIIHFPELNGEGYHFFKERINKKFNNPVKTVIRIHSSSKPYRKSNNMLSEKDKIIMDMEEFTIRNCDLLIYPSKNNYEVVKNAMDINNNLNSIYIPNSIDCDYFTPKKNDSTEGTLKIGYIGKIRYPKGSDILIKSFSDVAEQYPNIKLLLIGRQSYLKDKKLYYTDLLTNHLPSNIKSRIKVYGLINRNNLLKHYQSIDIFVFPSRYENFPNSLMEAMSCGLPVIASSVGGVPELLGSDNPSIVIPPNNSELLSDALIKMINDSSLRNESGQYNRKRIVDSFSQELITQKYIKAYYSILK